jgi:predicted nucleotide-binding protein
MAEPKLLERFKGQEGRRRLVEVLRNQELVLQNGALAEELAKHAKLEGFEKQQEVYLAGQPGSNKLYFVISGAFDLIIGDTCVKVLKPGQAVGEFPILNPSLNYTVTIRGHEPGVMATLVEDQFLSTADKHPEIWKNMAKMLVSRLYSTYENLPPANKNVFMVHGHDETTKYQLSDFLRQLGLNPVILHEQNNLGKTIIEKLEHYAGQANFAMVLMTPDDESADGKWRTRQNVIMELGWFMAKLGRSRTMILHKGQSDIEIPSDIKGLIYLHFDKNIEECKEKIRKSLETAGLIPCRP